MTETVQGNGISAQYPALKRKRPQQKKEKDLEKETKSNPSKRHRDRLNFEIENISQLIPFPQEVTEKLDKLSILRLAVAFLRNKSYHSVEESSCGLDADVGAISARQQQMQVACVNETESKLSLEALNGFLLVITQDFNVLYVSETIQSYLGYPQSDVMNQSILDLVHAEDRSIFMRHMQIKPSQTPGNPPDEGQSPSVPEYINLGMSPTVFRGFSRDGLFHRSFICRVRCLLDNSSGFLALHFTGHLRLVPGQNKKSDQKVQLPPECGLFLLASPLQSPSILEIRTKNLIFRTKHRLDYTPLGIDAKGRIVLGYTEQQLRQRSGYEFVHSADMMHCADAHTKLMRKGESGLTVFRLLHKDNKWLWVTASARLIFRDGRPDFIIATQRPILDQEGEEHMKKRTNAFRFDFTGQAILYGEVNPIGTQGGPENNPLHENMPGEPPMKRQRSMQQENTIDRKSLYGAQAMQRLDIYTGSIPHQSSDLFAKPEIIETTVGPPMHDPNITISPSQPQMQPCELGNIPGDQLFTPNCYQSVHYNSNPPGVNALESHPSSATVVCNQMHSDASSQFYIAGVTQNEQSLLSSDIHPSMPIANGHLKTNPLKRLHPSNSINDSDRPQNQAFGPPQALQAAAMSSRNYAMQSEFNSVPGQCMNYQQSGEIDQNQLKAVSHMQFSQPGNCTKEPIVPTHQRPDQQFGNYVQAQQQNFLQTYSHNPSVIESMTINSFVNVDQQCSTLAANNQSRLANNTSFPSDNYGETQLIAHQDNTIQFDLQKVATDYQTTDPLSKVQQYLEENPSHAMAIATGQLPEAGMPHLAADHVSACMQDYHMQPYSRHQNMAMRQQRMTSSNSIGKSINSNNSSPLGQPYNMSDDNASHLTLSISSVESFPPPDIQSQEEALGGYFKSQEPFTSTF